jgi:hypothetical protein
MSRAYNTHDGKDQNLVGKSDGKDLLEDLGVNRRILNWNLHKYSRMVCAGFTWLITVTISFSVRSIYH